MSTTAEKYCAIILSILSGADLRGAQQIGKKQVLRDLAELPYTYNEDVHKPRSGLKAAEFTNPETVHLSLRT